MDRTDLDANSGSSGLRKPSSLTVMVNGRKLQTLRLSVGMTQEELAEKAGYSDRLVRKAEASSPLRKSSIANLAEALSSPEQKVRVDDLIFSHETISTDMTAFLLHGPVVSAAGFEDLIDPCFTIHVAGQELNIPFAGVHNGPAACETFRDQLKRSFEEIEYQPHQTRCFTAAAETCVHAMTQLQSSSTSLNQPLTMGIWWFLKTRFEASRLISIELHYDTGNVCRLLGCL